VDLGIDWSQSAQKSGLHSEHLSDAIQGQSFEPSIFYPATNEKGRSELIGLISYSTPTGSSLSLLVTNGARSREHCPKATCRCTMAASGTETRNPKLTGSSPMRLAMELLPYNDEAFDLASWNGYESVDWSRDNVIIGGTRKASQVRPPTPFHPSLAQL
jgi:hypothetical protein